ncbi:hypothetical protein [Limimaricola pyoseonensis]|uniref:Sulfotransferase family protein n=1 Tax=Limimaricola pyoseonensis TaxID=521013 RepID=A0A1G6ZMI9_9RHOB|nr:hypothetical protein [Limimaricola pyoseonensis]SDE03878.1 hypothetical protein SAMN04488567_0602 [Limimaricola pyoseonensis]
MDIAFHIGAPCTDDDRLLGSVESNRAALAPRGTMVPPIARYRRLLRETVQHLAGGAPEPEGREVLLDAILEEAEREGARRLVLGNPAFLCPPAKVCEAGQFHEMAGFKARSLAALFPGDRIEMFLGIRNPAGYLPAVWGQTRIAGFDDFMSGLDPRRIRWSDVIARLLAAAPEARLTVWCDEDAPLIWGELIRRIADLPAGSTVEGASDMAAALMPEEGAARLRDYLAQQRPPEAARPRIVSAFLDRYARPEALRQPVEVPGWDAVLLADLSARYEADLDRIAAMDRVTLVTA